MHCWYRREWLPGSGAFREAVSTTAVYADHGVRQGGVCWEATILTIALPTEWSVLKEGSMS